MVVLAVPDRVPDKMVRERVRVKGELRYIGYEATEVQMVVLSVPDSGV